MGFQKKSKGAVLVEFALILPLLLLLTAGIIELSNAFMAYNNLNKSVRHGVRYLASKSINDTNNAVADPLDSGVVNTTKSLIKNNFDDTQVALKNTLNVADINCQPEGSNHVKVSATYNYNLFLGALLSNMAGFFGGSFPTTIPISASATFRVI